MSGVVGSFTSVLIHEQIRLPDGVEVDTGIANLLGALWDLGLRTSHSCQGKPEDQSERYWDCSASYISFPEAADAFAFFGQTLEAISDNDSRARIVVSVRIGNRFTPVGMSRKCGPALSLELGVKEEGNGGLRATVRFDPDLMPRVEAAFGVDGELVGMK